MAHWGAKGKAMKSKGQFNYVQAFGMTLDEIVKALARVTGIDIDEVDREIAAGIKPGWRRMSA